MFSTLPNNLIGFVSEKNVPELPSPTARVYVVEKNAPEMP